LGDGAAIISYMNLGKLWVKWTEPLESFLHLKAFDLAKALFNLDAGTTYALLSCVAGSLFIFLTFIFSDFVGKQRSEKILSFFILISLGSMELFFGYVEHYSFLYVFVFVFIFAALAYLEGKLKLIFPLLAFLLAILSHVSAVYLLPSVLFLFLLRDGLTTNGEIKISPRRVFWIGFLAFVFLVIFILGYKKYGWIVPRLFVPLTKGDYYAPGYTLFSLSHFLDFLNQQLLISPVGLILLLALLFCKIPKKLFKDKISWFLLIVALPQLLMNFLLNPILSASRDWDMFSGVSLGYTILGLYLFLKFFTTGSGRKDKTKFEYLSLILVVTSLYSTAPWIVLDSHEPKTIQRFRNLLGVDPKRSQDGHFILIKYFETHGMEGEAEKEKQVQRKILPEFTLATEGKNFWLKGELDSAEATFLEAIKIAPEWAELHADLGKVYFRKKELDKAEAEYRMAIKLCSCLSSPYYDLGGVYLTKGKLDSALEYYKKAILTKTGFPEAYFYTGYIYFVKGNLRKAEEFFKKTLTLKPDFEDAYIFLADVYDKQGRSQEAMEMCQTVLKLNPNSAQAHLRLGMLYLSKGVKENAIKELESFLKLAPESRKAEEVRNMLQKLRP
jgi:tetratricopeptide (TPR) repeat protein